MTQKHSQVPWTDEQWARVNQVIQEEAARARVAATFLPLYGPLPGDTDFVRTETISYPDAGPGHQRMKIDDTNVIQLATLQVKVHVRGAQMADPNQTSALQLFRRAANVLARLEDSIVFRGQSDRDRGPAQGTDGLPKIYEVLGGQKARGLVDATSRTRQLHGANSHELGQALVGGVSGAIGSLEEHGHFGPYAVVLGQELFLGAQTPDKDSLVLPQDRIVPFLGGGSLLRSSTLDSDAGLVIALGGAPVELVVATDVSLGFLQVTTDPIFVFRVYEKIALRIKEPDAIVALARVRQAK